MSSNSGGDENTDYRQTLFLPQTDFPMRAGLPKREPAWLERWQKDKVYHRMCERAQREGDPVFELHDGPPYANGHLHIGHALNKILKDFVIRSRYMLGHHVVFIPGWDCHGLPIEWKIEEGLRVEGKVKEDVPILEMRAKCRDFADHWIKIQRQEFERLGVVGDWENRYATMDFAFERAIAGEFLKFVENGTLYRGFKPVMWSPVEQTALADAEVEYHDHVSPAIYVRFPIIGGARSDLLGASVVIWTTTPWTIPSNKGVVYGKELTYGLYEVTQAPQGNWVKPKERFLLADTMAEQALVASRAEKWRRLADAGDIQRIELAHPWRGVEWGQGYWDYPIDFRSASFVDDEQGTGFVHCAPSHGLEEYEMYRDLGMLEQVVTWNVDEEGKFVDSLPKIGGLAIIRENGKEGPANNEVIKALAQAGAMFASGKISHSYPHSWRSKAPVIYRNTPQWFIDIDKKLGDDTSIRERALNSIDKDVKWVPRSGRNRLFSMMESRPDWVISRQRAWGVPLCCFVHKESGEVLFDKNVNSRILSAFENEGADAWFADNSSARFLGNEYSDKDWQKIDDILDVWFESGSTHAHVISERDENLWPVALYLEGSDQHRGWFHSSLLEACGTRGRSPYQAALTHGFTLDERGEKMSKSKGNTVAPQDVIDQYGADILRNWVAHTDYTEDQRIGPEILKGSADSYRRLRNTMRFLLGNLRDWDESEQLPEAQMPELERWILHRLLELDKKVRDGYRDYVFQKVYSELFLFCTVELSSFYFDIRKDALYCDAGDSIRRRAVRTVLDRLFARLTRWFAPILCFTMEEVWRSRLGDEVSSVHEERFVDTPEEWRDDALAHKWEQIRRVRRVATGALEIERQEKRIGSSLEAALVIYCQDEKLFDDLRDVDWAEICITSDAVWKKGKVPQGAFSLAEIAGIAVVTKPASGEKCQRCWRILPEVEANELCQRCAEIVGS